LDTTHIRIKKTTRKKLKLIAAKNDITMQQLIDDMISLYSAKTCKPKKT